MKNRIVCHLTSVHTRYDTRVYRKMCRTLAAHFETHLVVADGRGSEVIDKVNIWDVGSQKKSRILRMLVGSFRVLKAGLKIKADVYHFHDPELMPIGLILKIFGKKVIYDVHEDIPQQILRKHWIPMPFKRSISTLVKFLEGFSVIFYDGVISVTPKIVKRFPKNKTLEIRNYPLLEEFSTCENTEFQNRERITYIGAISKNRGIVKMVDAFENSSYKLTLGGIFVNPALEQKVSSSVGWHNVDFQGWMERSEVSQVLKESSIGLVVLQPTGDYEDAYPVKLFEYMAAGLAVVSSQFPLWKEIVEGDNCGLCVNPESSEDIRTAINQLRADPILMNQMGKNGQRAVLEKYNWDSEAKKLICFYHKLLN
jgi:glycosyltransferase involved in cell wall biosynthesis